MAENDIAFDENEGTVTLTDESGDIAVFHFFEETYIPLDDEDGVTTEFECISSMEYKGRGLLRAAPQVRGRGGARRVRCAQGRRK